MARYPVSGVATTAIEPATGTLRSVMVAPTATTRVFWLMSIWYGRCGNGFNIVLYDATAGATAGGTGVVKKAVVPSLEAQLHSGAARPGFFEFPAPGLKFTSGVCAALEVSGSMSANDMGGAGYEE